MLHQPKVRIDSLSFLNESERIELCNKGDQRKEKNLVLCKRQEVTCHGSTDQPLPWWGLHGQGTSLIRFGLARHCSEPCTFIHRCTLYQYVIPSDPLTCLGLRSSLLSHYHCYRDVLCFIVPLTWYSVSHDGLISLMDLWPCLLMFQGFL